MKPTLVPHLVCPIDKLALEMTVDSVEGTEILEGRLTCPEGHVYGISRGIPRLLAAGESDSDKVRTRESFSAKWRRVPRYGFDEGCRDFYANWYLERYGFGDMEGLRRFLGSKTMILEAGAGSGRDAALYGENSDARVFAVEISEGVEAVYANAGGLPNVHVVQADLTRLPFREATFDYVVSDQVLHHTPDTESSFKGLARYCAPRGHMAAYVYKKKGPIREFCDDFLRAKYAGGSEDECYEFSRVMTLLGKALSDLKVEFEIPEDIPILGLKAGKQDIQRFIYYHVMKCYWNDSMDFETNVMTNFDWYHPVHAYRHTPEEVETWCEASGLSVLRLDVIESGISVLAQKV